jgi:UDP-GlcNAc:undecaprenyl-phosphate GlcNAc-1-phosphate transferase
MLFFLLTCSIPAFLVSLLATTGVKRCASRWGLIDQPGDRKVHVSPTPLGGGIGVWLGVLLPVFAAQVAAAMISGMETVPAWFPPELAKHAAGVTYRSGQLWAILGGGTLLAVMGLLDDFRNLAWKPRLLVQTLVAGAVVSAGVRATLFVSAPWLGFVVTMLWILVLTNAFNFLDNMDGLSTGIGLIVAALFAVVMLTGTSEPRWLVSGLLLVLAGSCAGFLIHNRPPASIFMGDSGSYFLGFLIACLTVTGTFYDPKLGGSRHVMLAPLCVLAIPLYDFCSVMWIRLREGRSPFHADKSHFSHRLVELGLSQRGAVLTIHLATLTTGLGALLLYRMPDKSGAAIVVAMVGCVLAIIAILESCGRRGNAD